MTPTRGRVVGIAAILALLVSITVSRALASTSGAATVGVAASSTGGGWTVAADGSVTPFGGAAALGSMAGRHLGGRIVGMAANPNGQGYWLVGADGGVYAFGDAGFYGSATRRHLADPVVGMAPSIDGRGYDLVGRDGQVFAFGDARYDGSLAGRRLRSPVVGMAMAAGGLGYLLAASDGVVFPFGHVTFLGSMAGRRLATPITGIAAAIAHPGYRLLGRDGGIFAFGVAYLGRPTTSRQVALAATTTGYVTAAATGATSTFGSPPSATTTPTPEPALGQAAFHQSMFARSVSQATVLAQSGTFADDIVQDYQSSYDSVGVNQMPIFIVPASQPLVPVASRSGCGAAFVTQIGGSAPIPDGAYTTNAQYQHDSSIVISQPATHTVWELWQAAPGSGSWSACWGGRLDTTTSDGVFPTPYGLSATGISYAATTITERDVESGVIDHALALQIDACNGFTTPADRGDCGSDPGQPPEGTMFRMNPATPMPAGLTPFARLAFRALKTYGAVVVDQAGGVELQAESTRDWAFSGRTGTDPITTSWAGQPPYTALQGVPWSQLQAIAPPS